MSTQLTIEGWLWRLRRGELRPVLKLAAPPRLNLYSVRRTPTHVVTSCWWRGEVSRRVALRVLP